MVPTLELCSPFFKGVSSGPSICSSNFVIVNGSGIIKGFGISAFYVIMVNARGLVFLDEFEFTSFLRSCHFPDLQTKWTSRKKLTFGRNIFVDAYSPKERLSVFFNGCKIHGCWRPDGRRCPLLEEGVTLEMNNVYNVPYYTLRSFYLFLLLVTLA